MCIDILNNHYKNSSYQPKIMPIIPTTRVGNDINIIISEDIYVNRQVLFKFLNKLGYHNIDVTENGQECFNKISLYDYDIAFLDIRMPVLDGESTLRLINELKSKNHNKKIPYIIAVTAYSLNHDRLKYLDMGFDDYLPKPINLQDLRFCINNYLNMRS
jgi:CheY-like chemotaxis protein